MTARTVTLFGGAGFIGRYAVQRLAKRGWIIRAASRHPDEAAFLRPLGDVGQITPIAADITNAASVRAALAGADAAVNLVGILYERGRQRFATVHAEGARRVAEAAKAAGCDRLVHISAIGADARSPSTYARTKAAGEAAVRSAFPEATILRPSIVFGPEDDFFNRFAAMARLAPALPLIGGGRTLFQPVYVGDVADAIEIALERSGHEGETYELGGPRVYAFRELMEILLRAIERKRLLVPLPFPIAGILATFAEPLPRPPLTRDQVRLLRRDNVVGPGARTLADLGIEATALELVIPSYLEVYRPGGRHRAPGPA